MWRFIFFIIIFVIAILVGLFIAKDPGLALFTYQKWSVEMPLWFFFFCFILILLVGYFILRILGGIDHIVYRFKNWLQLRRKYKSYNKTNRGLIELLEGHWKSAEHYLNEGIPKSDAPLINYLASAKAAHEQGAYDRRDGYLRKAHIHVKHADIAIGVTSAQLQMNQGQYEQALATLGSLRAVTPRHPLVLKLLERVYIHLGDWKNLLRLLPSLSKAQVITSTQYVSLEKKIYEELLKSTSHLTLLKELWKSIPSKLQKDPEVLYCYAKELSKYSSEADEIEGLLNKFLKKTYDKNLVQLYGLINASQPKRQLQIAESWLKRSPNDAVLLLCLGRICVRCQLWGKARAYFEDSLKCGANAEIYAEFGKLLEYLGDSTIAMQSYRDGLKLCLEN